MTKEQFAKFWGVSVDSLDWCEWCKDWNFLDKDGYDTCGCE